MSALIKDHRPRARGGTGTCIALLLLRNSIVPARVGVLTEHLRLLTFNQSYMNAKGVDKVTLYSGIEGDIGNSLREQARLAVEEKRQRAKFTFTDSFISGYTDDLDTAAGFGENGIVWKKDVPASDIIVHKELLSGIIINIPLEHEYLLKGGNFEVNLHDMYVRMVLIMKGVV